MFHPFFNPPALKKIDGDGFSSQQIAQESPPALEPLNDDNSLENLEKNSSPTLSIGESVPIISFDKSSSLTSFPDSPIAVESSALLSAFNSEVYSSSLHTKIEFPKLFQPSSPKFSLDSEFKVLGFIKLVDTCSSLDELEYSPFNITPPACSHQRNLDEVQELDSSSFIIRISLATPSSPKEFYSKPLQKRKQNNIKRIYSLCPQKRIFYK
ncbi:hypothetical protein O181_006571 [Austropuccinia psidii MF-1]|uniref:Uncharacterized protein n=1 Tax=Austropuccinia psidii MF-1 TaxID=1389203 RepID=A0A9Q3GGV9_9BASI|nr:hypothetical protein [Austropuccinia psidii MF-1]